ncbi:MAG: helix-turn-helix domain-containing protein, partial [Nitrososphaerales archaeon]
MASTYELMERNPMRTDSIACTHVDLELLNKEITQTLLDLGLTDEEARTLPCLNKRGEMRALEISRSIEIRRTRLYSVLESLESKGLVFSTLE